MFSTDVQRFFIAFVVLGLFAAALAAMTFALIPEHNRDAVIQLIGGINTLAGLVIGFYFGKSAGDKA